MKRNFRYLSVLTALFCFSGYTNAISYTTLDYPGAKETYITGIDGDTVVGYYSNQVSYYSDYSPLPIIVDPHGFVYDGQTWTTLDCPRRLLASSFIYNTMIEGIDNGIIVGSCLSRSRYPYSSSEKGFVYDGQNWTLLNFPGASDTYVQAIDGSNIAGYYQDETGSHGFVYNGTTWNTLLYPWIDYYTRVAGISGNNVAIYDYRNRGGVIYNLDNQNWNTIEFPEVDFTRVLAIDGINIVGFYGEGANYPGQYFLYNGTSWTTFDLSFPLLTHGSFVVLSHGVINDMDGNNIVGYYRDATGVHGFAATIPEPATLMLLAFGGFILRRRKL